ncbi:MAG TPA: YciI family protein [Longimicrobiaceae bacterium]|nr:YciI family protein [Longimicrobiaceae bacterium]
MKTGSASYLLIFRESTPDSYEAMSPEELRQSLDAWNGWCDSLAARGKLQSGQPLAPGGRLVSKGTRPQVLDGPFAEAKELIGGYFLVTAADLDEATALAEECPLLQYGMTVEVRPVAPVCHLAVALGWETMREPATV